MSVQKKKRQIIGSSAALLSIAVHILLLFLAGGIVALRYFAKILQRSRSLNKKN